MIGCGMIWCLLVSGLAVLLYVEPYGRYHKEPFVEAYPKAWRRAACYVTTGILVIGLFIFAAALAVGGIHD